MKEDSKPNGDGTPLKESKKLVSDDEKNNGGLKREISKPHHTGKGVATSTFTLEVYRSLNLRKEAGRSKVEWILPKVKGKETIGKKNSEDQTKCREKNLIARGGCRTFKRKRGVPKRDTAMTLTRCTELS